MVQKSAIDYKSILPYLQVLETCDKIVYLAIFKSSEKEKLLRAIREILLNISNYRIPISDKVKNNLRRKASAINTIISKSDALALKQIVKNKELIQVTLKSSNKFLKDFFT